MSLSSLSIEAATGNETTTDLVKTKETQKTAKEKKKKTAHKSISRSKIISFKDVMKDKVVGQEEASSRNLLFIKKVVKQV